MLAVVYLFSLLVVLLTVTGIAIENGSSYSGTNRHRSFAIAFIILCPIINSFMACAIIVTAIWLLFYRHG